MLLHRRSAALERAPGSRRRARPYGVHTSRVHGIRIVDLTPAGLADEVERIAEAGGTSALPQLRALWRKATGRALALRLVTTEPAAGLRLPSTRATRGKRIDSNGSPRTRDDVLALEQVAELRAAVRVRHPDSGSMSPI